MFFLLSDRPEIYIRVQNIMFRLTYVHGVHTVAALHNRHVCLHVDICTSTCLECYSDICICLICIVKKYSFTAEYICRCHIVCYVYTDRTCPRMACTPLCDDSCQLQQASNHSPPFISSCTESEQKHIMICWQELLLYADDTYTDTHARLGQRKTKCTEHHCNTIFNHFIRLFTRLYMGGKINEK